MRFSRPAELVRFGAVGVTNTLVSLAVYTALPTPYWISAPVAFAAGAVNGYVWNRRWTFGRGGSAARYGAVQLAALAATDGLLYARLHYLVTLLVVSATSFAACRVWVFRQPRARSTSSTCATSSPRAASST